MRAGILTRAAESSGGPSSLVRTAGASCAFPPRRVASSETARKAVRRSAAETARRTGERDQRATLRPALAEREPRRRSGKLAIFCLHPHAQRAWLRDGDRLPRPKS